MFILPGMPLTHQDNGISMGGSMKEVYILKIVTFWQTQKAD
jgi:hypothetical protein